MSEHIKDAIVNVLRKKIGMDTALRSIFTHERVQAAQEAIDAAKDKYFDDVQEIMPVFQAAAAGDVDPQRLYETTKSLKAQTEALGFSFLMDLSNSLYKFLQGKVDIHSTAPQKSFNKDDILVVQKYAEAIIAALEKQERGKGGMVESSVLNGLEILRQKYSKPGS